MQLALVGLPRIDTEEIEALTPSNNFTKIQQHFMKPSKWKECLGPFFEVIRFYIYLRLHVTKTLKLF